jgi:hypothetical protein
VESDAISDRQRDMAIANVRAAVAPVSSAAGSSTEIAERNAVKMPTDVLQCGSCEEIKLGVHAGALALAVVMGVYNAAAWLSRRQRHLAINAVLYAALTAWEQRHVVHHLRELRRPSPMELDGPPVAEPEPLPKLAA